MAADTKHQQRKKEESKRLRGEGDHIRFIDLKFERWHVVGLSELYWGKAMAAYTSSNKGRKKKASSYEEREIRSSLFILDVKYGKL